MTAPRACFAMCHVCLAFRELFMSHELVCVEGGSHFDRQLTVYSRGSYGIGSH